MAYLEINIVATYAGGYYMVEYAEIYFGALFLL